MQALLETQKDKAITNLQYEVESAESNHQTLTELLHESKTDKKGSKPQQAKQ
jgi:hypothetical protein